MRVNTNAALTAFVSGGRYKGKRDLVENGKWFLHGNLIAQKKDDNIVLDNCGWDTPTTRDRLYAVMRHYGVDLPIRQRGLHSFAY